MASYPEKSVENYLSEAAAGRPTPGGGSVAALAGALAAAMAAMVAAFTISSKKCAAHHAEAEDLHSQIEDLRKQLEGLIQADVDAYEAVAKAYGLPRGTKEERRARRAAIRHACAQAIEPPLKSVRTARHLAALLPRLAEIGNRNLITDAGVAAHLVRAAFESAALNVQINLHALDDSGRIESLTDELASGRAEVHAASERTLGLVRRVMEGDAD